MQESSSQSQIVFTLKEEKEAVQIILSQLNLLIINLSNENSVSTAKQIKFLLSKSSITVYVKFWKKLILLCSSDIKNKTTRTAEKQPLIDLLFDLFSRLPDYSEDLLDILRKEIFCNREFGTQSNLSLLDYIEFCNHNSAITETLDPTLPINRLKEIEKSKMNNSKYLETFLSQSSVDTMETQLNDLFLSLSGESLNEMVALLLSEVLSPGSQKLQERSENSWFTPSSVIDATQRGQQISNSLKRVYQDIVNWNRVFNLMSTKYFLTTPLKPTTASLSSFFASLKYGYLIDQFFGCDWNITFKLTLTIQLHDWSPQQTGCFDLLNVPDMKRVSEKIPNSKNSLLYLLSISTLDLELFLLRDELVNNPMLSYYQKCFFEDFNLVPEYLYLALINNMKHFTLLIENKNTINEIIITLLVQVFEKSPVVLGELLNILPSKDKLLSDVGRAIIERKDAPVGNFIKLLHEQDKLDDFLNKLNFSESFPILPAALKVGWVGFKQFMESNININTAPIIIDSLEAQTKMTDDNTTFRSSKTFDLESLHFLITLLMNLPLSGNVLENFESLEYSIILSFPRIINYGNGHDKAILANGEFTPINSDVEKEMQSYLQKMYSGDMAIKDVVDILRKLKDSDDPRDQDVFACITHAILGECTFFKDYPLEALATTSVLFGSMILFHLLNGFVLDVALRIIINFAKEGPDSKMFKFAIQALYAFRIRLSDFPGYCKDFIEQVPGLQAQSQIYKFILDGSKAERRSPSSESDNQKNQKVELTNPRYFNVSEWQPPVAQDIPPKETTEKVLFIVNNLTMDNFDKKRDDLKNFLKPSYYAWFSNYLVNQRAKTEPNYHKLYSKILTSVNSRSLYECMVNTTLKQLFFFIAVKNTQSVDKKLLKNLASWLGSITLAIDKPIKYRNIAFRELLIDSYKENRLDIIVPFVCKVLMCASDSKIFKPPNPWTVGILKVLLELNEKANWKLSLTFEVEVLFKALNISMKELKPSNYIEVSDAVETLAGNLGTMSLEQQQIEHQRQVVLLQQHQQHMLMYQQRQQQQQRMLADQTSFAPDANITGAIATGTPGGLPSTINSNISAATVTATSSTNSNEVPFNNLSGTTVFATHPDLKRVFQMALAKSVREILIPTIEKSSGIAVIATVKIITKDFATELDELKLKAAAVNMVRHLAQSFTRATTIDLLKETIRNTTQSLAPNLMNSTSAPLEELDIAINDNVNLGLALIEKAAMDKAVQDIGEQLMQAVAVRRYHKERRSDQPFLSPNANIHSLSLPEPLGLKTAGVTPQQFRIYEDFAKSGANTEGDNMSAQNQAHIMNQQGNAPNAPQSLVQQQQQHQQQQAIQPHISQPENMAQLQTQQPQAQGPIQQGGVTNAAPTELEQNHRILVHLMDILVAQIKENTDKQALIELGEQNELKNIIYQILTFIAKNPQKDQLALKVSQAVVNSLFATSESSLCREVLSLLLEKLCSLSIVARKDVVWWLVYALDSRKFDVAVIRSLLKVNLIDAAELDNVLVTAMRNNMENAVTFAMNLLRDVVLSDKPILMRMDFIRTLEYLSILDDDNVKQFLQEYNQVKILPISKNIAVTVNEKYSLVFTEWVKLLQKVDIEDSVVLIFIKQMMDKGILSESDNMIKFMKCALELSVSSFKESDPTGEVFTAIDALGKLIIKLLIFQEFSDYYRGDFLNTIYSTILLVFAEDHEQETFNERPYFRLLSNLFYEWSNIRGHKFSSIKDVKIRKELYTFDIEFYNISATYLHSFQPFAFPGFSFAWVSLISHRMFLPQILRLPDKSGWEKLTLLIIDLFKFLDQYTKRGIVSDAISVVYKGTLRVILGISNDVPDFLIENHYELMNNLPATYFQLKNVILSSIPKKKIVPNPYDPNLNMADVELCQQKPSIFYDPVKDLQSLKKPVDNYLRIPSNSLLKAILNGLYRTEYDVKIGVGYDYLSIDNKLVRGVVLHVGIEAGLENERTSSSAVFNTKSSYYTLLYNLINEGSTELRYQILQVMLEQLRYPNIHTYWFSYVLLNMFTSKEFGSNISEIQEIMLRCLLERVIVNKPHTWGIIVFFTQLLQNKEVNILELDFIKNIPEIENILEQSVKHTSRTATEDAVALAAEQKITSETT
ncbi:hypothetical protein KAFR_0J02600 [Kazachstania africana CBS 2517]|uniref:General negative regulator of transcription subunit 1 n=1 Tax=Kazachstania africana (strain ATCC 22294 / BCRC 22015 / CBS 2517 / CECT 1963 / NBRC 1671 / NRRL Y-8276) TaxID=1071382 RepID=H2B124_KAZAF|nr:hypothetical protein KAFR_0J02600 [Kazachstania africana CBS 2517]CCF60324.1 hypothetical protein KAFR_0J02600 [Kazachstania africana CBS 2517]